MHQKYVCLSVGCDISFVCLKLMMLLVVETLQLNIHEQIIKLCIKVVDLGYLRFCLLCDDLQLYVEVDGSLEARTDETTNQNRR